MEITDREFNRIHGHQESSSEIPTLRSSQASFHDILEVNLATQKIAFFERLDLLCQGQFRSNLLFFLQNSKIDPTEIDPIENAIFRGWQHILRIQSAQNGENISPPYGEESRALLDLDWFFRAITIVQKQEFGKGSMKIPDPDGKLALFITHCTGSSKPSYHRHCSHWENQQEQIKQTSFDLNGVKELNIPKAAIGFDFKSSKIPLAGIDNTTLMVMLLPETDQNGQIHLHIGLKSEEFSTKGFVNLIRHGLQWFDKKILHHETPSPYHTVRKEDKLPEFIKHELNLLKQNDAFKKSTTHIQLHKWPCYSDPTLQEVDAYLAACEQTSEGFKNRIHTLRTACLKAELQATYEQISFSSMPPISIEQFLDVERDTSISFESQVKQHYTHIGLPEPSTLTSSTEVLLPSLEELVKKLN